MTSISRGENSLSLLEIVKIDEKTRICDILDVNDEEENEEAVRSPTPFEVSLKWLGYTLSHKDRSSERSKNKLLNKKIVEWKREIEEHFLKVIDQPDKLQIMQSTAEKILDCKKLALLTRAAASEGFASEEFDQNIESVEKTITRIATLQLKSEESYEKTELLEKEKEGPSFKEAVEKIKLFLALDGKKGEIVPLMQSLNIKVLSEIIYHLEERQLAEINSAITSEEKKIVDEIANFFNEKIEAWVEDNNNMKKKIDDLCKERRRDIHGTKLSSKDLELVKELTAEASKMKKVFRKIHLLIRGVVTSKSYQSLVDKDIPEEYSDFLKRLDKRWFIENSSEEAPRSSYYKYIFEGTLKRAEIEFHAAADATFDDWTIIQPEDFRSIGLLGKIDDSLFHRLKNEEGALKNRVKKALEAIGIVKVSDWHEKEVYNKNTLIELLQRPEIKENIERALQTSPSKVNEIRRKVKKRRSIEGHWNIG